MNYLAHMFLSCRDESLLIGNFISDFISNKEKSQFNADIQKGIELHRQIDTFTDTHEQVYQANDLIRASQEKYTPVVTDIFFDHFLIKNWDLYTHIQLSEFTRQTYDLMNKYMETYPDTLKSLVPLMINDDFLMSCKNEVRLRKTFQRVANRAKFPNHFDRAYDDLMQHYEALERHFKVFFPELMQMTSNYCGCLKP